MPTSHIHQEVAVLRGWVDKRMDGSPIPGQAFGCGARCDAVGRQRASLKSSDYYFSLEIRDNNLVLTVDAYSATNEFTTFTQETWDDDAWEDQMLELEATPCSREIFYALSTAARALLNGRSVRLPDGSVIPAIGKVLAQ